MGHIIPWGVHGLGGGGVEVGVGATGLAGRGPTTGEQNVSKVCCKDHWCDDS
jgi:hypothetical protein